MRRNRLEALRRLDPSASLEQELTLRLVSSELPEGALPLAAGDALFKPLQDSVSALADHEIELEVVGISTGSTVLHVRPRKAPVAPAMGAAAVDTSADDPAMRALIRVLQALEEQQDVRAWAKSLTPLDRLASALDRYNATMDVTWSASDGASSTVHFGASGRSYLRSLMETVPKERDRSIGGRVTELRESGVVRVKTGVARNSPAFDVRFEPSDLISLHLSLGETVHFLAREVQQTDQTGVVRSTEWHFRRLLSDSEVLNLEF